MQRTIFLTLLLAMVLLAAIARPVLADNVTAVEVKRLPWDDLAESVKKAIGGALDSIEDAIVGAIKAVIKWIADSVRGTIGEVLGNYTIKPIYIASLAVPVCLDEAEIPPELRCLTATYLAKPIMDLFEVSKGLGAATLCIALIMSVIWLFAEGADIVRQGEAMMTIKRCIIVAIILVVIDKIYNAAALCVAYAEYYILTYNCNVGPLGVLDDFAKTIGSVVGTILGGAALTGAWAIVVSVIMLGVFLLGLAAMKLLLIAVLASLLPFSVALTLIPWRPVRDASLTLVTMLVNLLLANILIAAMIRFGWAVAQTLWSSPGPFEAAILLAIILACMFAPVLALAIAPRAGVVMTMTAMFLGYAARPAISGAVREIVPRLEAAGGWLGARLEAWAHHRMAYGSSAAPRVIATGVQAARIARYSPARAIAYAAKRYAGYLDARAQAEATYASLGLGEAELPSAVRRWLEEH